MRLITSIAEMRRLSRAERQEGKSLGLVPTMGALHEGHLSLVRHAQSQCDAAVVSIFVNPTQFGPGEDLARYPRDLDRDIEALSTLAPDAVFTPTAAEMYPQGFDTFVDPGEIATTLEGTARPGHFRGVSTVVLKLFHIVAPDAAYFGQKDFQQTAVIRRLVADLNLGVTVVVCPIVREPDGLAMSSRNAYLGAEDRKAATVLHRALQRAEALVFAGETDADVVIGEMCQVFAAEPQAALDYAAVVEPEGLRPVERVVPGCVALVAARVGRARLIDNVIFGQDRP
ncbi:MAG TPA: pantoate--beta-alanine ligase [Terriglobia bacterium]|nr:pantoate--beta-alanine ligase [Terriglobia bacterium]